MTEQARTLQGTAARRSRAIAPSGAAARAEQGYAEPMEGRLQTLETKTQELRGKPDRAAATSCAGFTIAAPAMLA